MPEAPEVQTVLSTLETQIKDVSIEDVLIYYPKIIDNVEVETFKNQLIGQTFHSFNRLGKYLIFGLDDYDLVVHLRMEGKFYLYNMLCENKHIHIVFKLNSGTYMSYHDTRKFGRMIVKNESELFSTKPLNKLALDANDPTFTKETLHIRLKGRKIPIKEALLNQEIIAGLGNIYVDEVLFASRISPLREACDVSCTECGIILEESRKILNKAISYKGTTIRSYTSSLGVIGEFQNFLCVHTKEICPICKGEITKTRISGRGTYYCARCQK